MAAAPPSDSLRLLGAVVGLSIEHGCGIIKLSAEKCPIIDTW
jgi:hypothetical protein